MQRSKELKMWRCQLALGAWKMLLEQDSYFPPTSNRKFDRVEANRSNHFVDHLYEFIEVMQYNLRVLLSFIVYLGLVGS